MHAAGHSLQCTRHLAMAQIRLHSTVAICPRQINHHNIHRMKNFYKSSKSLTLAFNNRCIFKPIKHITAIRTKNSFHLLICWSILLMYLSSKEASFSFNRGMFCELKEILSQCFGKHGISTFD